jgi:hypothetical protein
LGKGSPITWQNIDASLPGRRDWIRGVTLTSGIAGNKFSSLQHPLHHIISDASIATKPYKTFLTTKSFYIV